MPLYYTDGAIATGVYARCKGRNCKKLFEVNNKVLTQVSDVKKNM